MITPEVLAAFTTASSFAEALDAIFRAKYTGPLVLHCYMGVPQDAELPPPPAAPTRISLRPKKRRGLTPPAPQPHSIG